MIIRFRRLLSLPLNLGRLRLRRSARDRLRRRRVSSVSRRRIRVRLHSRLFLALLRARALSPRLSRARRAPGFPFSPPRVIRRPSQLIIRNRREYRILRVIETSRIRQSPRSRVHRASSRPPPPPRTPHPARGDPSIPRRSSRRIASVSDAPIPSFSRRRSIPPRERPRRSSRDRARTSSSSPSPASPRARRSMPRSRASSRRRRSPPPRAPVGWSVGRRARRTPSGAPVENGRVRSCFFNGRAKGGVHYDDSWPSVLGIKKTDGRMVSSQPAIHPRCRARDSRPLDGLGGGD